MVNLLLTFQKVWLAITFFPIENQNELTRLRRLLSPFMESVRKCYVNEYIGPRQRETLCDAVINSVSSTVDPNLLVELNRLINLSQHNELVLGHQQQRQLSMK